MIKGIIIALLAFSIFSLSAEEIKDDSISVVAGSQFTTDYLGNVYVITPTNDLIKYNRSGSKLATANFKVLGNISFIDAGNPFEIYVFYRDQNKILFLDNLLNLRGECDLDASGLSQIACIARSSDNQIWLFDMADLKLKKYSKDLKLLSESATFNTYPVGNVINPTSILDINSSVFILNNNHILEFDIFSNFIKTVISDSIRQFQYSNNRIFYMKSGKLIIYDRLKFKTEISPVELPPGTISARLEKGTLFILMDEYLILRNFPE